MLNERQLEALRSAPLELNRLQVAMDLLKLTQKELEEVTGIAQPTISRLSSGLQRPQIATAHRLALYFGCTIEDLWPHDAASSESSARTSPADTPQSA